MKITKFRNENFFLSNFYQHDMYEDGIYYTSVESYFQAHKLENPENYANIGRMSPLDARRVGRRVDLRADWEEIKVDVMRSGLKLKFSDPSLMKKLLATGDAELIEENTWNDTFWGVCNGKGKNMLGKLLMEIRANNRR